MAKKNTSEFPFSLEDRMGCLTSPIVAVEESFMAVRVVYRQIFPEQRIVDHTILRDHISVDRDTSYKDRTIYYVPPASENPIQTHIAAMRRNALEYGATPEAIRLLGALAPWTDKEKKIMAEKLKSKASAAKPDKEGLKSAAKAAPVSKGKAAPKKGNAEALAKARAARSSGPDNRKIKALVKPAEIKARPGTYRHTMLTDLLKSKTVQEFRDKNSSYSAGDLRYAIGADIVSVA